MSLPVCIYFSTSFCTPFRCTVGLNRFSVYRPIAIAVFYTNFVLLFTYSVSKLLSVYLPNTYTNDYSPWPPKILIWHRNEQSLPFADWFDVAPVLCWSPGAENFLRFTLHFSSVLQVVLGNEKASKEGASTQVLLGQIQNVKNLPSQRRDKRLLPVFEAAQIISATAGQLLLHLSDAISSHPFSSQNLAERNRSRCWWKENSLSLSNEFTLLNLSYFCSFTIWIRTYSLILLRKWITML